MQCSDCPADIFFARTAGGARMPIESTHDPAGNVAVRRHNPHEPQARVLKKGEEPAEGETRHQSHFVRCPAAAKHRRKK